MNSSFLKYLDVKLTLMKRTFLLLLLFSAPPVIAQNTVSLNANSVSATISDNAVFFTDPINTTAQYEVPAGSGKRTIFAASLWVGAEDINGQVHVSGSTFNSGSWSSGPIADNQSYGTVNYVNAYGTSIWKVTRQQVLDHQAQYQQTGYSPIPEIADWPGNGDVSMGVADQLAPFVDNDGDGVYEPLEGDHPDFPGDEVVYVIVNDEANPNLTYLGVEIHLMFYQFNDNGYLGETTFLNSRVFNRSTTNYYNFRQAMYTDFDIGNYQDDYIGCDSARNMMYAYNGDAFDETNGGALGYGMNAPCQAVMSLNRDMFSASYYTNGAVYPTSDPVTEAEMWNYLNGLWADGSPMYYGGNAYNTGPLNTPTQFVFSGNPFLGTGWTEGNANNGGPNPPEDRRAVMVNHVGDLLSGASICSDFAFIYDDSDGHLENVQNVQYIADALQNLYDSSSNFPCGFFTASVSEPELDIAFEVFPNPSHGTFTIQVAQNTGSIVINVRDMMGRLIHSEVSQLEYAQLQLDVPAGVYQVSVQSAHQRAFRSLVIQ